MKITVTGGAGFIGSELISRLKQSKEHEVTILDTRIPTNTVANIAIADITNFNDLLNIAALRLKESDTIIHLAGFVDSDVERYPYQGFTTNTQGTLNILEMMRMLDIKKLVFASTYLVYEGHTGNVDEETKPDINKIPLYAKSKLISEWLIKKYADKYGLQYVILRFGSIYGEGERCSNLINNFVRAAINNEPIEIWGDGAARKPLTYVKDLVNGIICGLNAKNDIFNIASGEHPSVNDLTEILKKINPGLIVKYDRTKPVRLYPTVISKKIENMLGWKRETNFEDNIKKIYNLIKVEE